MSRRAEEQMMVIARQFIGSSALLLFCSSLFGCGRQINFLDPEGPRFTGRYAPPAPDTTPEEIRVVTFNVKYAVQVDRAIEVLRESDSLRDADIIALQEMNDGATDRMARALRMNYVYLPASISPITDTFFGPALLARWPIDSGWKVLLPHASVFRGQRRTATAAIVRVGRELVRVYSVHLETQASIAPDEREDQAAAIVRDAEGAEEPVILAGDFNSYAIAEYFERHGFRWLTKSFGETILLWSWDHLLVRGFRPEQIKSVGVERNARGASDHRPMWAVLRLGGRAGRRAGGQRVSSGGGGSKAAHQDFGKDSLFRRRAETCRAAEEPSPSGERAVSRPPACPPAFRRSLRRKNATSASP